MDLWSFFNGVRLREPIEVDGKQIHELKFREPTANDLEIAGIPFETKGDGPDIRLVFDGQKMTSMIARLANVDLEVIRHMRARDWSQGAWNLAQYLRTRSLDETVLDSFRLAKYYGVDPTIFLNKPISEIQRMVHWTNKLIERAALEGSADD